MSPARDMLRGYQATYTLDQRPELDASLARWWRRGWSAIVRRIPGGWLLEVKRG